MEGMDRGKMTEDSKKVFHNGLKATLKY